MLGLFESKETKAWKAYKARTKGASRVTKEKFLETHFPKKKAPDDTQERYTYAKDRTEAIGNQAMSYNAINAKELARFHKAK
jgi:hypothetical protein